MIKLKPTATNLTIILVVAILVIVFAPFIGIWGLNVLFNLSIPYTFETWFAAVAVKLFLTATVSVNNS